MNGDDLSQVLSIIRIVFSARERMLLEDGELQMEAVFVGTQTIMVEGRDISPV